jgi:hypothetical protein
MLVWPDVLTAWQAVLIAPSQISSHAPEEIVVEELIQLAQRRISLFSQFRHPRDHILRWVAVDEHSNASLSPMGDALILPSTMPVLFLPF